MTAPSGHWDHDDIELMGKLLRLNPDLELAGYLVKLVREHLRFPVASIKELAPLFRGVPKRLQFGEFSAEFEHADELIPPQFFPIESEDDFIQKAVMVAAMGRRSHSPPDASVGSAMPPIRQARHSEISKRHTRPRKADTSKRSTKRRPRRR